MSENKRFTLCEGTITGLKSYYEYDGIPLTHLQVLTLLNKLYDENKELKAEIRLIEKNHDDFYDKVFDVIDTKIKEMQDEMKKRCNNGKSSIL